MLAAARAASPSGELMPSGNVPGWTEVFAEDFVTDVPVGQFPGTDYGAMWGRDDRIGSHPPPWCHAR